MVDVEQEKTGVAPEPGTIVVVGAGVCGLTAAHVLARAGKKVVLLEKLDQVGGLARSFTYGEYTFDIGPHRFHTGNKEIGEYIRDVLGEEGLYFPRRSSVYFKGRYYAWPIRPQSLIQLPKDIAIRAGIDLMLNPMRKYDVDSFETYILKQYGPTLYQHFFLDYSEKFLKIHPRETHADWAKVGINRAIIDDNVKMNNLFQLAKSTLSNVNKEELNFLYPKPGLQTWCDRAAEAFQKCGGELLTGVESIGLTHDGKRIQEVQAQGRRWKVDQVIWTGGLHTLCNLLGEPAPEVQYLPMMMYFIELKAVPDQVFQWCYFGDKEYIFNRVSNTIHFSPYLAPWGCCGLEVEVTCHPDQDDVWMNPERYQERVITDLMKVGLVSRRDEVRAVHMERIPQSYPIYRTDYRDKLKASTKRLARWRNLVLAGRTGQFWYNNMDHSIGKALRVAKKLMGNDVKVEGSNFGREDEEE